MNEKIFTKYKSYLDEVDAKSNVLFNTHKHNVKCTMGCSSCCMAFNLFPIEYYYIKSQLREVTDNVGYICKEDEKNCLFLKNNTCTIYKIRPYICRTHGLPLVAMGDDDWELSFCELNFTKVSENYFQEANTFPQDTFNSKLFLLNRQFLIENLHLDYSELDMIPMNDLLKP